MTPDPSPLQLLVLCLAVYRLTLLVVADTLTAPARDAAILWLNERKHGRRPHRNAVSLHAAWQARVAQSPHRVAYLLDCPWCASMWASAAVLGGWYLWGPGTLYWYLTLVLAAAAVAAIVATRFSPDH